jgi:hypothetical protein
VERPERRDGFGWRVLAVVAAWLIRALGATLRIRIDSESPLTAELAAGRPVIVFGWHEYFLIGCCVLRHYRPYVMISHSRDGERIARVAERVGWRTVRGSSSRGGARALREMVRVLTGPVVGCHLADGPRGPRHELKPGVIALAQLSGAMLVPTVCAVRHKWCAPSWDRLQVPLPFTRVDWRHLAPRFVPRDLDANGLEVMRLALADELERETLRLETEGLDQSVLPDTRNVGDGRRTEGSAAETE